jgi:hypothetical protein
MSGFLSKKSGMPLVTEARQVHYLRRNPDALQYSTAIP